VRWTRHSLSDCLLAGCILGAALALAACSGEELVLGEPGVTSMRRLTESEYRHSIADVFGENIEVRGRFEPDVREHGLNALGTANLTITPSGFEQYYAIGASVVSQAFDEEHAPAALGCSPPDGAPFDEVCARDVLTRYGRKLLRRPLDAQELDTYLALSRQTAEQFGDFTYGVRQALAVLLSSPDFLFRIERSERHPEDARAIRLDGFSKAARLSYFLWNTTPDDALLAAAENGSLHTEQGLEEQVKRLIQSPRLTEGVRALFRDILQFDQFANVTKDASLYPKFSQVVATSAQEETLQTIVHHLLTEGGDYRELFTTQQTFIDRSLAAVYQTPYRFDQEWSPYTFPESDERAGIVSQISFLTLHSHPGESSPTKRGVAINEIFRCEETPDPPANVDFSIVQDTDNPELTTRRRRLMAHSEDPSCAGCHKKLDPLGLPLDRFDALGQHRELENGEPIDVSLEVAGIGYTGAPGLGRALASDPQVSRCFVDHVYGYATGTWADRGDRTLVADVQTAFAEEGYHLRELFSDLVTHPDFFRPSTPEPAAPGAETAAQTAAQMAALESN